MTRRSKRIAVTAGVALAFIPLLQFAYLGLHIRPQADDYDFFALPLRIGIIETILHWRSAWHSYYTNFLTHGLMAPLGAAAPAIFSVILIATLLAAYTWLANTILASLRGQTYRRAVAIALAALMTAATINGVYAPHSFHWYSSAVEHMWSVALLLLGIALAIEAARRIRGRVQHGLALVAVAFYALMTAGFTETFLVFQLTVLALIIAFIVVCPALARRGRYFSLALAACLGSFTSLALQLSAPGFANRRAASAEISFFRLPLDETVTLAFRSLEGTLDYAGHQAGIAGFMLVAFAALFATLAAGKGVPIEARSRRLTISAAPLAGALVVQVFFVPLLWLHHSDNIQVLSRFSYGFMVVVCINLSATLVLLALLWRRELLAKALDRRHGLMIYCSGILLVACFLLTLTQIRSIHYKASTYLFLTAVSLFLMLGSQLAKMADEPNLKRLFALCAFTTAGAFVALASLITVEMLMVRFISNRTLAPVAFALMLAGLMNGVALGALIQRGYRMTAAKAVWINWLRLGCLLAALAVAAGIVIGQGRRVSHIRKDAEIWDLQHQEILRLRDEGDPSVFTKLFKRPVLGKYDQVPLQYSYYPLTWRQRLFYGLDDEDAYS